MTKDANAPAIARPDKEAPVAPPARPLVTAKDIYEVPRLAVQGMLAWSLPELAWWPLSRLFGEVNAATHPERTRNEAAQVATVLRGTPATIDPRRVAVENWANRYEERFHYMRAWRPGGWEPAIDILGGEHVSAALDKGRGIIFWAGNFSFNDLIAKIAWRRLGLAVSHFSRPIHGFSTTRFGVRYLNAVRRGIEDRYLGERLMAEEHETQAGLEAARATASKPMVRSRSPSATRDGTRRRRISSAAASRLPPARSPWGARPALRCCRCRPCVLRRAGSKSRSASTDRSTRTAPTAIPTMQAAVQTYADWVTPFVLRDPGQWRGWRYTSLATAQRHRLAATLPYETAPCGKALQL